MLRRLFRHVLLPIRRPSSARPLRDPSAAEGGLHVAVDHADLKQRDAARRFADDRDARPLWHRWEA